MDEDMRAEEGFLILADISGFTAFVTRTELEHGAQVTAALLEAVMDRLEPPLEIQELEGDAVFALGPERLVSDGSALPGVLVGAFAAFKRVQRQLAEDDGCACRACGAVPNLDLKLIVHHGRFVRHRVGGRARVAGPDVILVHRLLKNPVGGGAYLLLTAPALEHIGDGPVAAGLRRYLLSYPHFGEVPCFAADLDAVTDASRGAALAA